MWISYLGLVYVKGMINDWIFLKGDIMKCLKCVVFIFIDKEYFNGLYFNDFIFVVYKIMIYVFYNNFFFF